jgi:hypothetical protein
MPNFGTDTLPRCKTAMVLGTRSALPLSNPNEKVSAKYEGTLRGIGQVQALRQRKKDLEVEMELIRRIKEHKEICLAAGAYGGYSKLLETLHPALRQVTAQEY